MPKKKRGRVRGRGGPEGGQHGGQQHGGHPRGRHRYQPRGPREANNQYRQPDVEPSENGEPGPLEPANGILELHPNGYGFLRSTTNNYQRERTDPFMPGTM